MAKLTKEQFLAHIQKLIGEDNSDEALTLLEDFTDTYNELEKTSTPAKAEGEDWETKYKENDASWRKKYRDRFNGIEEVKEEKEEEQKTDAENIHIADLFKESEVK